MTVLEIVEEWSLVVADFASEYHIRLVPLADEDMSWLEFYALLSGLLQKPETRIHRKFTQQEDEHVD